MLRLVGVFLWRVDWAGVCPTSWFRPGMGTSSSQSTDLKRPVQTVKVAIGGQDAQVQYAGSAGDSVAGLLQVNVVVPQTVVPGATIPISITVGAVPSQSGVTIAVQ